MADKQISERLGVAGLLCAVLVLAGCQDEATPELPPEAVAFVTVGLQPVKRITILTGEIAARNTATYSFKTSGRVSAVAVDVGAKVKAGDVLAELDPTEQQADVAAAEAAVSAAEAQLRQAQSAYDRQRELLSKGFTTRGNFDNVEQSLSTATSAVDSARADLENARTGLSDTSLRAEADGVITSRSVDPGQVVSAAQSAFGFAEDGPRDAIFDIQEQLLIESSTPPAISVALVSNPAVATTGHVREISPLIDTQTGTVAIKVGLDGVPPEMTLGSAVIGQETEDEAEEAIVIPWTALMAGNGAPAVWVVDQETGAASLRPITVASYQTGTILVASGLSAGDRVITDGSQLVRPGQIVDLAAASSAAGDRT